VDKTSKTVDNLYEMWITSSSFPGINPKNLENFWIKTGSFFLSQNLFKKIGPY
jgi:hypothetical protein